MSPRPLAALQEEHAGFFAAYTRYQVALMGCEADRAAVELAGLRAALAEHAALEDAVLVPIYRAVLAEGPIEGGGLELFAAEHQKLERLAAAMAERLAPFVAGAPLSPEEALGLIEAGFTFKHLLEHHTQREDRAFYPAVAARAAGREGEVWAALDAARAAWRATGGAGLGAC